MSFGDKHWHRDLLSALVPVICPSRSNEAAVVTHVCEGVQCLPTLQRSGFVAALAAFDIGSIPRFRKRARFLPPDTLARYWSAWKHGPNMQKQWARALGGLMKFAYYEQPSAMDELGYTPAQWVTKSSEKRLRLYQQEIEAREKEVIAPDPLEISS